MTKLVNPTGLARRVSDKWGRGHFGAARGGRAHMGLDIKAEAGQLVKSPIEGVVIRNARPYGDGAESDCGVLIAGDGAHSGVSVKLFYVRVPSGLIGRPVKAGEIIGAAADLSPRYPAITNHVHLEVRIDGVRVDPEPLIYGDPTERMRDADA